MNEKFLIMHGHFYQPPRGNPLTRSQAEGPGWPAVNETIWRECYAANAALGSYEHMSFDLGPTLAEWMDVRHPETLAAIRQQENAARARLGAGSGVAQAYHHTILPLATDREKTVQVEWGRRDFVRRFGHAPRGLWLAETACDHPTLETVAAAGLEFAILAPWQASDPLVDTTQPYRIDLPSGRSISVFFYARGLSGELSFADEMSMDAYRFAHQVLPGCVDVEKERRGLPQVTLICTDGELYGHHKPFRDQFLSCLLTRAAPSAGFTVTTPGAYLAAHPATVPMTIRDGTSWSCAHGVARWDRGCGCTEGSADWKGPLRAALRALADRIDEVFEAAARGLLRDPWDALLAYPDLRAGALRPWQFLAEQASRPLRTGEMRRAIDLLEMQFARQAMFVSCAWFFDDLDRLEPRIALAQAARAAQLADSVGARGVTASLLCDLTEVRGWRSARSALDLIAENMDSLARAA